MAKALAEYEAKRDFSRTTEPRGSRGIRRAEYPRFVIQKHDATRLHYDLRLEVDGVFKSWAVTRGPSRDPADKRLAVEVEDHPLAYGDFEGTIPEGEYGGGTVMIWDRGYYSPLGDDTSAEALAKGELKFNIAGEKLKGSFVLVRMKRDSRVSPRNNWLLIKHRDSYAKPGDDDALLKKDRSVASKRNMGQIAAGKGNGPVPFMLDGGRAAQPDAVWHSDALHPNDDDASPRARKARALAKSVYASDIKQAEWSGNTVAGVAISNPVKALWPKSAGSGAITKKDLAQYLATVGPWMIAHIEGRPCSVVRAPDGIGEQTFFQRHIMQGVSDAVTQLKVSGDREPYLQIDTVEALVSMGQLAALEFHPWNCAPYEPSVPGRLVFDLDPASDVTFDAVVTAAREMRERLEKLGLTAFCKTTGGKGLHVVTPLKTTQANAMSWRDAKTFAQAVCTQMAHDSPDRYLTKMTLKLRRGRIFLDYLRNDTKATAVAPLSPRARPGAPVSMPLNWGQVRAGLDPKRFDIRSAPNLLSRSKAWDDYARAATPLKSAIQKLIGNA
ncbi:MAG: non-homologous end-joining DNA ligase [Hyphomicrobiaceae bacterium]